MLARALKSSLVRASAVYASSRVINAAIPFLLLPVLTRYLTPEDYGKTAMFAVLLAFTSPLVGLSLHGAISVRYFDTKETDIGDYIGNCFFIVAASTLVVGAVVWLFAGKISAVAALPIQWLWAIVLLPAVNFAGAVQTTVWQAREQPIRFALYSNASTVVNLGLSLLMVVGLGTDWEGRVAAQVMASLTLGSLALFLLCRGDLGRFRYNPASVRNALRFGIPLIPHAIGSIVIGQTDRIFLTNMVGVAATGVYSIAYQFGMMIELAAGSFNQAYVPWLYRNLGLNDATAKRRIVKLTYLYFGVILACALLLALIVPPFLRFFVGSAFVGAGDYIFWSALGFAFGGMYYMVANYIFYAERTSALASVTFLTAVLNVGFSYALIRRNGAVGAAQATTLSMFTSFILTWLVSARVYPMPWRLWRGPVH